MEFSEKLKELRRQKGMTQEQLAGTINISRTAISKWESGRGYPSIEALRHLAEAFGVSIDDLLSTNELAMMTEKSQKQDKIRNTSLLYGILDLLALSYFFLPLCVRKAENNVFIQVSLLSLPSSAVKTLSVFVIAAIALFGLAELLLQTKEDAPWKRLVLVSLGIHALAILYFSLCHHPYLTVTLFLFFLGKLAFLLRQKAFSA
jgi:transcriptional regulator with XRE-family HTH domain